MLKKTYTKTRRSCRVTFKLNPEAEAGSVALLGEFNSWDETSHPMKKLKDGSFSATVSLPAGHDYRFRYLLDGEQWVNEPEADSVIENRFGSTDSVVTV
jgi:1,4-alpha-glucan branching enzyme